MDPTFGAIIIAGIAALGSVVAAFIGLKNGGKLNVIHTLTNSNLADIKGKLNEALDALAAANAELEQLRDRPTRRRRKA